MKRTRFQKVACGVALAVIFSAATLRWLGLRKPSWGSRVYRIGWMISPPFQVRGDDGKPAGLSVDLVREAARRRGINLQWVFWQDSSEAALRKKAYTRGNWLVGPEGALVGPGDDQRGYGD